jgi:hypothetical protein
MYIRVYILNRFSFNKCSLATYDLVLFQVCKTFPNLALHLNVSKPQVNMLHLGLIIRTLKNTQVRILNVSLLTLKEKINFSALTPRG